MTEKFRFSTTDLKWIAAGTMLIDHIAAVCIEPTALYTQERWTVLAVVCRLIGRLAFPLFAWLLVQGFLYTSSRKAYLCRLIITGVISEIPFDLAVHDRLTYASQNTCLTMALGLALIWIAESVSIKLSSEQTSWLSGVFEVLLFALGGCLSWIFRLDYSFMGIFLIAVFYWFRGERRKQCIAGSLVSLYEMTAVCAFWLIARTDSKREERRIPRLVFYGGYPLHFLILYLIRKF